MALALRATAIEFRFSYVEFIWHQRNKAIKFAMQIKEVWHRPNYNLPLLMFLRAEFFFFFVFQATSLFVKKKSIEENWESQLAKCVRYFVTYDAREIIEAFLITPLISAKQKASIVSRARYERAFVSVQLYSHEL